MLDLSNQEKQVLIDALDVAVKATGLNGAAAMLPIAAKIQASIVPDQAPKEKPAEPAPKEKPAKGKA